MSVSLPHTHALTQTAMDVQDTVTSTDTFTQQKRPNKQSGSATLQQLSLSTANDSSGSLSFEECWSSTTIVIKIIKAVIIPYSN